MGSQELNKSTDRPRSLAPAPLKPRWNNIMVRVMLGVRMVLLIGVPLLAWLYQTRVMYRTFPAQKSNQSAAFITGASSGIGRSVAQQLASEGWTVFATVRSDKDMKQLRQLNVSTLQPIM